MILLFGGYGFDNVVLVKHHTATCMKPNIRIVVMHEDECNLASNNVAQASPTTAQAQSATALTAEPPAIVLAPTAASETTAPTEESPAPMRLEQTRRPPAVTGNICWRTPGIQEKLIEDLRIPSCQLINESELFRIREFRVDTPEVKPGDFDHMPNLKELRIEKLRKFPEAATFDGLRALEKLNIRIATDGSSGWGEPRPTKFTVSKGTFDGLGSLKQLEINNGTGNLVLEDGALYGLERLEYILLRNLQEIPTEDLADLGLIKEIEIFNTGGGTPSFIPKNLIARLPTVERLTIEGFQWPSSMEMNSSEHACLVNDRGIIPREMVTTFNGKVIQYQGKEHRDGKPFCILKVEDEIHECRGQQGLRSLSQRTTLRRSQTPPRSRPPPSNATGSSVIS